LSNQAVAVRERQKEEKRKKVRGGKHQSQECVVPFNNIVNINIDVELN
jgi:hypothetical protein